MRLTVGPLPAAVYWRRRLLVLGVLLLIIFGIVYACTDGPGAGNGAGPGPSHTTTTPPATEPSATGSAEATASPTPAPTSSPTPTAFTLPVAAPSGPCTDAEIELTASASPPSLTVGQPATFTLTIKNISNRTCVRDIGSAQQELQLRQNELIAWSSDDCGGRESYEETLPPGFERSFPISWGGYRSRTGTGETACTPSDQLKPDAGNYDLVARLGTKFSEPVRVDISSSGA